jgi:hypothetical protein
MDGKNYSQNQDILDELMTESTVIKIFDCGTEENRFAKYTDCKEKYFLS